MQRKVWLFVILCSFLLAGCHKKEEVLNQGFQIYYLNKDMTRLVPESYDLKATELSAQVEELMVALLDKPKDPDLILAKPKEVNFIGYNFGEAGQLQLSFDDNYNHMDGISEVLMRAAIVKTFCQLQEVHSIEFFVNGLPLVKKDKVVGRMSTEDFIDTMGDMTEYYQTANISIYFSNREGNKLFESQRQVKYEGSVSLEQVIVEQLIDGPIAQEKRLMKKTVPDRTKINKISKKDGICTVDLSAEFLKPVEKVNPKITIYSLVNTLIEQPSIDKVQILIDGEVPEPYHDIDMSQLFERNLNLMEGEK